MAIFASASTKTTSVGNSATLVFDSNNSAFAAGATLRDVTIQNTGSVSVYLGTSSVTSSTGLLLAAGQQITFNRQSFAVNTSANNIYAITASGTSTVVTGLATVASND